MLHKSDMYRKDRMAKMIVGQRPQDATARRPSLADRIYDSIKMMILQHEIAPRGHVGIDELARDLAVSQTPVREALARLEADGLVTKIPLRGYEATDMLTVDQFDDLFQFRELIEPWAAARAARSASRRDLELIDEEMARAEAVAGSGAATAYPDAVEHDTRFHALVARASGSSYVQDAFLGTHCHMHLFRIYKATLDRQESTGTSDDLQGGSRFMFDDYRRNEPPKGLNEHAAIARAIAAHDSELAADLMLMHLRSSRAQFILAVEQLNL